MNFIKKSCALVLFASLAACIEGTDQIDTVSIEELAALQSRAKSVQNKLPEDLVGTATMSGGMYLGEWGEEQENEIFVTVGNMNMVADFTNSEISGAATELKNYNISGECSEIQDCDIELLVSLDGELVLDGVINGPNFTGTLNGELTASEEVTNGEETFTATSVADIEMDVAGSFLIDDAGLMAGADLLGDASVDYSVDGEIIDTNVLTFEGLFIVAE